MIKTDEVFGLSVDYRPLSYVDRGNLDAEVSRILSRDVHLALRGVTFPRNCGQSEKLLQQHQED